MSSFTCRSKLSKECRLVLAILGGLLSLTVVLLVLHTIPSMVYADPIDPPDGYPKLSLSLKTVTPTLAPTGGVTLYYAIEIRNTGAYTADGTILTDIIPDGVAYNDDFQSSISSTFTITDGVLTWSGNVGFDSTVIMSFSVTLSQTITGTVRNTAVISHPLIAQPVTVTDETVVTDHPILTIEKTAMPKKPGANQPLIYTIVIANQGQPADHLPITVTDRAPLSTTVLDVGMGGMADDGTVTWMQQVSLDWGETTEFTFSVMVHDVPSGTVIANDDYQVASPETGVTAGEPYTITIIDPIFLLSKHVWPDPPGSNREMTYTLTLLNVGSLATDLVITDRVPTGVEYRRGGSEASGIVSWTLSSLDTHESAEFDYTVYVSDVMGISIVNADYLVCSAEEVCQPGKVMTRVVQGPIFETFAEVIPIAKKTGGEPTTPTLGVRNIGHGNALSATVVLTFSRMQLTDEDVWVYLPDGTSHPLDRGPDCVGAHACRTFPWTGDIAYGELVTFNVPAGIGTIGGETGLKYVATIIVTDSLSNMSTPLATSQDWGIITHYASVVPYKRAPTAIGRGQLLTYTIRARNGGFSTDLFPVLTDTVPLNTAFVRASDGGATQTLSDTVIVSWTLPLLGPGDEEIRTFTVRVDNDLISGTQILNNDYAITGYGNIATGTVTSGSPVTTTVTDVGLIDSKKEVTPTLALPGPGNVFTYHLHIVNSSLISLTGVTVYDLLPWQYSTYQRDAVASAGEVTSDIVSIKWTGDVAALSSEVVTFTVLADSDYQGPITNTAVISHPDLLDEVVVQAVAYVTELPVLRITKSAAPDPVKKDAELFYTIRVVNLGQQATDLVITDTVPENTEYVAGGELEGAQVRWETSVLEPGDSRTFAFQVTVGSGLRVVNDQYAVRCAEGVIAFGDPVVTRITGGSFVYLPLVLRDTP